MSLQEAVLMQLRDLILRGEVKDGSTVHVDEGDGKLALGVS